MYRRLLVIFAGLLVCGTVGLSLGCEKEKKAQPIPSEKPELGQPPSPPPLPPPPTDKK